MTDSEGKEIALDGMTAFDRQDVGIRQAPIREAGNRNPAPPVAYLQWRSWTGIEKSMNALDASGAENVGEEFTN